LPPAASRIADHDAEQLLATVLRRLDKLRQIKDAFSGYDGPQG